MPTANEVAAMVQDLAALPSIYASVRRLVEDPDSSAEQLARLIATDPALTARLLRLANSAFWGRGTRIETVSRAVRLLGMNHVHDLVLATSVATAFRGLDAARFDTARFWRESVYRALAAGILATKRELVDVERLFLEGLLADIGHLAICQCVPELADGAFRRAASEPWRLAEFESALIGCNYADVGAALAEAWLLPECFVAALAFQLEPADGGVHALEAGVVHTARWLGRARHDDAGDGQPPLAETVLQLLGLPEDAIAAAGSEADANLSGIVQLFMPALAVA